MYWDVVEVIPEPDYCLFVRFKDGAKGRVRLRREELTLELRPLLQTEYLGRVYIDSCAVKWHGYIYQAPDTKNAEMANEHSAHELSS